MPIYKTYSTYQKRKMIPCRSETKINSYRKKCLKGKRELALVGVVREFVCRVG